MVKSGVKAYFPDNETLLLFNRSSNPKKKGLIILNGVGVVDADYVDNPENEGEIAGLFYNMLDEDVTLKAGGILSIADGLEHVVLPTCAMKVINNLIIIKDDVK